MARLAATEYDADWVLNNDADEFWWPLGGTLKDMLAAVPDRYGQLVVARHNFLPRPGDGPFWERMVVRESASRNLLGDELEPNALHRAHPDVTVDHGNHWVTGEKMEVAPRLPLIEVLHFPARSYVQFERKVRQHARSYSALADRPAVVGRDQLAVYEIEQRGELPDWFSAAMRDHEGTASGLASGELVVDRRLAGFMTELRATGEAPPPPAPERLAARRLAERAFALAEAAELSERRAAGVQAELAETVAALEDLRNSRLVRWTRAPRNAWYRARKRA